MMLAQKPVGLRSSLAPARSRAVAKVVCKSQPNEHEEQSITSRLAMPMATVALTTMLSGAMLMNPEDAMAARSSGRVGGSSGFSARKSAPPARSSTTARSTTVVNNTVVMAPPMMAPPLFGGFGFGGFHFMPTFFMPMPFFGGIFQMFFLLMIVSVVFSVIRNFFGSSDNNNTSNKSKKDDGWGDL